MTDGLVQYYRCPERYIRFAPMTPLSIGSGYFKFGAKTTCYGNYFGHKPTEAPAGTLHDAVCDTTIKDGIVYLPFDPSQVAHNLRCELYTSEGGNRNGSSTVAKVYYFIRPILPVRIRRHLQKLRLRGWEDLQFPRWPVDCSVDNLFEKLLSLSLQSNKVERIPFIWFWPEGASSAAIMTHDVETDLGRDFCTTLMDVNDRFGIKASFQVVPEKRYTVSPQFLSSIRDRGFEVAVHDLNHDGHLYKNREQFRDRAAKINSYGKEFRSEGFRAGVLYRKQLWFDDLEFSYDMSVPNVAHLDPQRGGCCTVMPYFVGRMLEIPVTMTQDYTLFHILNDYSIELWKRQIELIMEQHGLISFIVHPDYIVESRERSVYETLLAHLVRLKQEKNLWITTPGEVNRWWRQRSEMRLVENGPGWRIEGPGKERARIAYASEKDGQLALTLQAASGRHD